MEKLPQLTFLLICEYLDSTAIFKLLQINKLARARLKDEEFWRKRCLETFPWFFWTGECSGKYEKEYNKTRTITATTSSSEQGLVKDCESKDCLTKAINIYHPLPTSWRVSFALIYSGKYTGLVQVLNSLQHREMSAFLAIATFNYKINGFYLSYNPRIISEYRRRTMIILGLDSNYCETISLNQRLRLRRVPPSLLPFDCRELYAHDLFNMPLTNDGRPAYRRGDDVEIQWRSQSSTEFAWWKGIVLQNFMSLEFLYPTNSSIELPNLSFSDEVEQGILIHFPQYPLDSPWSTVVVSNFGNELLNANGVVGGIRKVECIWHIQQWNLLFNESVESVNRMLNENI